MQSFCRDLNTCVACCLRADCSALLHSPLNASCIGGSLLANVPAKEGFATQMYVEPKAMPERGELKGVSFLDTAAACRGLHGLVTLLMEYPIIVEKTLRIILHSKQD